VNQIPSKLLFKTIQQFLSSSFDFNKKNSSRFCSKIVVSSVKEGDIVSKVKFRDVEN